MACAGKIWELGRKAGAASFTTHWLPLTPLLPSHPYKPPSSQGTVSSAGYTGISESQEMLVTPTTNPPFLYIKFYWFLKRVIISAFRWQQSTEASDVVMTVRSKAIHRHKWCHNLGTAKTSEHTDTTLQQGCTSALEKHGDPFPSSGFHPFLFFWRLHPNR